MFGVFFFSLVVFLCFLFGIFWIWPWFKERRERHSVDFLFRLCYHEFPLTRVKKHIEEISRTPLMLQDQFNFKDSLNRTFFHIAVGVYNDKEFIKHMLDLGAYRPAKDDSRTNPLEYAAREGAYNSFKAVLNAFPCSAAHRSMFGYSLLHFMPDNGVRFVKKLIKCGLDVNDNTNASKTTPLHTYSSSACPQMVSFLLSHGADLFLADNTGKLPIDYAKNEAIKTMLSKAMNRNEPSTPSVDCCQICFASSNILALVPCGHVLYCQGCISRLPAKKCPSCRVPFTATLKIFNK